MSLRFQKTEEDFTCGKCEKFVEGDGFTNHCPECLWSKHVDVNPGDRAESCGGFMEPVAVRGKRGEYVLVHVCEKCGFERLNKVSERDNFDTVLNIVRSAGMV